MMRQTLPNGRSLWSGRAILSMTVVPWAMLLCAALCLAFAPSAYGSGPDTFEYQILLPPSPTSGADAVTTFDTRSRPLLASLACGSDIQFAMEQTTANEDMTGLLVAKLEWAAGHPDAHGSKRISGPCTFTRYFKAIDLCNQLKLVNCDTNPMQALDISFRADFVHEHFRGCSANDGSVRLVHLAPERSLRAPIAANFPGTVAVDFFIQPACLVKQINSSLLSMMAYEQMGTSGAPCFFLGESTGEWDFSVRNLTRLTYLNNRYTTANQLSLIGPEAMKNLQENLLTADGGPADEAYSFAGCGNTEESKGSSQDRVDERDWTDEPFWQSVGDFLWFLFRLLVIIVLAYLFALAFVTLLGTGGVGSLIGLGAVAAAVTAVVVLGGRIIPETENHLLQINSSKFLKNQMILTDVPGDNNGSNRYRKDQNALRDWLLAKMQTLLQQDFIEYNSRPYNRLSTFAIQNLADFAQDDDVRKGAQLVLDYETAKFAIGSQQGRRFVPFRRKREDMAKRIDFDAPESNGLFDLVQSGDQQVGLGIIYAGQVEQMRDNDVSFGAAGQALYAITSTYRPEDFVTDLAISKDTPVFQRIHHVSGEVYSSGRSFLISAGGLTSGLAYNATGSDSLDLTFRPELKDDLGVAMPTTLFLSKSTLDDPENRRVPSTNPADNPFPKDPKDCALAPPDPRNGKLPSDTSYAEPSVSRTTLGELIRIDGIRVAKPDPYPSYNQNLCVWDGFACGLNIVVPPSLASDPASGFPNNNLVLGQAGSCFNAGPAGSAPEWSFIDSRRCRAYYQAPRFFVAMYRQACPSSAGDCQDNFGFFEVKDADRCENFDTFKAQVTGANPPGFLQTSMPLKGTYHSVRGQAIEFQAAAGGGRNAGIISVNGSAQNDLDQWSFAEGSAALPPGTKTPITSTGDGLVRIWNPHLGKTLELDFRNKDHPDRRIK